MLTLEEAERRVQEVWDMSHDPEAAHILEDSLHQDVLLEIAQPGFANMEQARQLCTIALRTKDMDFPRHMA